MHSTPEISLTVQLIHPFYTSSWEQRKVDSLFEPLTERNDDLLPYSKTLSVATMTYKEVGNGAADSSLANYKRLRLGDIAFEGHTSKEFRYGRFVLNDTGDGIMSPRFSALRPVSELPVRFWKYYIHYEPIMKRLLVNCTKAGTMMNELVVPEFLRESLLIPSTDEQVQIGQFFTTIDNLITLHQRKGKAAVTGCSNDANNSKGVYCKARDFGYKCYKKVKSQQIRCLIAVFIFFV